MKWEDLKKRLKSITPEESRVLSDLATFAHLNFTTDEAVEVAIDNGLDMQLRDSLMESHGLEYVLFEFHRELNKDMNNLTKHIKECEDEALKVVLETKKETMQEVVSKFDAWKRRAGILQDKQSE